jgi:hypothetical protein
VPIRERIMRGEYNFERSGHNAVGFVATPKAVNKLFVFEVRTCIFAQPILQSIYSMELQPESGLGLLI